MNLRRDKDVSTFVFDTEITQVYTGLHPRIVWAVSG